jgi:hypothetical protein
VSDAIRDNLNAYLIRKKIEATAVHFNATAAAVNATDPELAVEKEKAGGLDVCTTFSGVCRTLLDDMACPAALRTRAGCTAANTPDTLRGACRCGALDASESVKTALLDLMLPAATVQAARVMRGGEAAVKGLVAASDRVAEEPKVEFCQTYANTCAEFLTAVGGL